MPVISRWSSPVLPEKIELFIVKSAAPAPLSSPTNTASPDPPAVLFKKVAFVISVLLLVMATAPPSSSEWFPTKVTLFNTVLLLFNPVASAPPILAELL